MTEHNQTNLVYGWFINDPEHLYDIPRALTNADRTEKCVYIGKVTEGKYGNRTLQNRISEHEQTAHDSNRSDYNTNKYVMLRECESKGITIEHRKLADLTGSEEFDEYVRWTVAGHPTMNMKYGDKVTNFRDEMIELMESGVIKTEEDFEREVAKLEHEYKKLTDEEYAARDLRRTARMKKMKIENYTRAVLDKLVGNNEDMNTKDWPKEADMAVLVSIHRVYKKLYTRVNKEVLQRMISGELSAPASLGGMGQDIVKTVDFWLNLSVERTPRMMNEGWKTKFVKTVLEEFRTDDGYDSQRFFHSIGRFSFGREL